MLNPFYLVALNIGFILQVSNSWTFLFFLHLRSMLPFSFFFFFNPFLMMEHCCFWCDKSMGVVYMRYDHSNIIGNQFICHYCHNHHTGCIRIIIASMAPMRWDWRIPPRVWATMIGSILLGILDLMTLRYAC